MSINLKKSTHIFSSAPVRMDLAGGTLDIWPIYLMVQDPITINVGINLFAECELTFRAKTTKNDPSPGITLVTEDLIQEVFFQWKDLFKISVPSGLSIHLKLLQYFMRTQFSKDPRILERLKGCVLRLHSRAKSPAGAGLGGSSALSIAVGGALWKWVLGGVPKPELIDIVKDIESQILGVPAGLQDYYGAYFGGLQLIRWGVNKHTRTALPASLLKEIDVRFLLFYSGKSRNSGINNWVLYKDYIDKLNQVPQKFQRIASVTMQLATALSQKSWPEVQKAIYDEWSVRKSLAAGISSPEMNEAFSKLEHLGQPFGFKVCGAGGGGCFFVVASDPEIQRKTVLEVHGIQNLPYQAVSRGLVVKVMRG